MDDVNWGNTLDYFHLLEVIASEVFSSNAMARHSRTAHYLSALATLSHALARRQLALAEIERYSELLGRTLEGNMQAALETRRQESERDRELAELELRGVDLWINALSGAFVGKDQLIQAANQLADNVAGAAFTRIFPSDEELDLLVAGLSVGSHRSPSR